MDQQPPSQGNENNFSVQPAPQPEENNNQNNQELPSSWQKPQEPAQDMMPKRGKKSSLLWIIIIFAVAVAGVAWWYIDTQIAVDPVIKQQTQVNQEEREDRIIDDELNDLRLDEIDSEFEEVDQDIESL